MIKVRKIIEKNYRKLIFLIKKGIVPNTLFQRTLLIVAGTLFVIQVIFVVIVYDNLWRQIRTTLIKNTATDIAYAISLVESTSEEYLINEQLNRFSSYSNIYPQIITLDNLRVNKTKLSEANETLYYYLKLLINNDIYIHEYGNNSSIIQVIASLKDNEYLSFYIEKDLFTLTSSNYLVAFMFLFYCIVILIIVQFIRIQVRPLKYLAEAAILFGKGDDAPYLKPSGSIEIREASLAFNEMKSRINNFIEQRTMMLSSISHDLKTSLTKMNLIIDVNDKNETTADLKEEIINMQEMISSYLVFAQEDSYKNKKEKVVIKKFFKKIIENYTNITIFYNQEATSFKIDYYHLKRAMENIINNSYKYSSNIEIAISNYTNHSILIEIEDDGPGIPPKSYGDVFKPFYKLNEARTPEKGSVGLGLYIVKDIISKHGGNIKLDKSIKLNGLKVSIILPFN